MAEIEEANKAIGDEIAKNYDCEDEEVLWEGSPLHEHLMKQNFELLSQATTCIHNDDFQFLDLNGEAEDRHKRLETILPQENNENTINKENGSATLISSESTMLSSAKSFAWPQSRRLEVIQVEVARRLLESDLLIQEDEDFINNFLLSDAALEDYHQYTSGGTSSILGDVLLFSGSVAAVAGAVFFLSERTRAVGAAAAAALLPTAMAFGTASTTRIATKMSEEEEKSNFDNLIKRLLGDMQLFKKLVRKCLNLLQGMELIHAGNVFAINSVTGAPMASVKAHTSEDKEQSCLSKALSNRAAFPALRKAAYQCTIQLITAYRSAVERLMEVSPLADHVDLKDHYIAFIDLKNFGIDEHWQEMMQSIKGEEISVKMLKDTVQVALVQQSEYLRRFGLVFCESVREDNDGIQRPLNKAGVLKHISELIETLDKINKKLSRVFDYHEAMGIDLKRENNQTALTKAKNKCDQLDFVPLRTIYTSLFSTGLHLQNSLLRVRQLEKIFDLMEKRKYEKEVDLDATKDAQLSIQTGPTQLEIIQWLKGFEEIQGELNACVGCLEDGVNNIDKLQNKADSPSQNMGSTVLRDEFNEESRQDKNEVHLPTIPLVDNNDPRQHLDEVFEAVMDEEDITDGIYSRNANEKIGEDEEFQKKLKSEKRLMQELKTVLVAKHEEHEKREARAIARQKGSSEVQLDDIIKHGYNYAHDNGNSDMISSPDIEQNNEYSELVINCNHTTSDSPIANKLQANSKKMDPFLNNNGLMKEYSEDTITPSKLISQGFEDSFVPNTMNENQFSLLEKNGRINNSQALESYLQDSINAINNSNGSLDLSPRSVNEETQTDSELTNGSISSNNSGSFCQSNRKYIQRIFEKKGADDLNISMRSDDNCNISKDSKQSNYDSCKKRRSRDLPHLQIEKNYSADESDSVSDTVSSDQGTVKLKAQEISQNSDLNYFQNEHMLSVRKTIPRSISGQVLTDEDDDISFKENGELKKFNFSGNDNNDNQTDSDEYTSSNSGNIDSSSDSSDYSNPKKFESDNYVNLNKNDDSDYIKAHSAQNSKTVGSKVISSPVESSMTQSISSSEASSFVYKENSTSISFNSKARVSRHDIPLSMTSSFYSTVCHSKNEDKNEQINCSLSDIRSVSTPDLKRLAIATSTSSPYISLDDLTPKADDHEFENSSDDQSSCYSDTLNDSNLISIPGDEVVNEGSIHSSTEWGSADELDHHVLKSYRRPLRPAANITPTDQKSLSENKINVKITPNHPSIIDTTSSKEKRKAKRNRNQSLISEMGSNNLEKIPQTLVNESTSGMKEDIENKNREYSDKKLYNSILDSATQSVYLARKKKENGTGSLKISLPRNPIGFDSLLASQVAQKAKNFSSGLYAKHKAEEVFGDPDSD